MGSEKRVIRLLPLILLLLCVRPVWADEINDIETVWLNGNYRETADRASIYLSTHRVRADVTYWMATSFCRVGNREEKAAGKSQLSWLRNLPSLPDEAFETLDDEIRVCGQRTLPRNLPRPRVIGSFGNLKIMILKKNKDLTFPDSTLLIDAADLSDRSVLIERLIPLAKPPDTAVKNVKRRLVYDEDKDSPDVALFENPRVLPVSRRFVMMCFRCVHTDAELRQIGQGLESHIDFFSKEYGMSVPKYYVTIYATSSEPYFGALAKKLHGLSMGITVLGYSIPDDMSMVVILPSWDRKLYGTLKHELFHLMNEDSFTEAPPWIEEGMAALYEISHSENGRVVGDRNWRESILSAGFSRRPTVQQLIEMRLDVFNMHDPDDIPGYRYTRTSINHAMARYFALYLQKEGKLAEVYRKMRNIVFTSDKKIIQPDSKTVLEETLDRKIDGIDRDFDTWFKSLDKNPARVKNSVKKLPAVKK